MFPRWITEVVSARLGWLSDFWERLQHSYWLIPTLMLLGSVGLAYRMVELDFYLHTLGSFQLAWFTSLQGDGARTLLSDLATSMETIAGVVFSITIVALQLASSQFGPHVLRSFLSDKINQVSLGTFVACFLYAFFVILAVRDHVGFVPAAATYTGLAIAAAAMLVLIIFISHVAYSIRIESVINALAHDIRRSADGVFPHKLEEGEEVDREEAPDLPALVQAEGKPIFLAEGGYIRRLNENGLMGVAEANDLLIWLIARPGDFIASGGLVMEAAPAARVTPRVEALLRGTVITGARRTPEQDVPYALQQLAEVAIRALSPGINAPFNATPCIDMLGDGLVRVAGRRMPSLRRRDRNGRVRVLIARGPSLSQLTQSTFGPIASAGRSHAAVSAHLVRTTLLIAGRARTSADRQEILSVARNFSEEAQAALPSERERVLVREALGTITPG